MKCVGGPLDGQDIESSATVIELAEAPDMAYHRTRRTDTNWRETIDQSAATWMLGEPEPVLPEHVWEWHERDWVSPEVAMIRGAVEEASARFR